MIEQTYRTVTDTVTGAVAIAWTIDADDDCYLHRITFKLSAAATSAGSITVTLDSVKGAAFDCLLDSIDPVALGVADIVSTVGAGPYMNGDKFVVAYANPDARTINCTALYGI